MPSHRRIWFPAKDYGWGWGPPVAWQGWVVLAVYLALVVLGSWLTMASQPPHVAWFTLWMVLCTAALIWICWLTGERPAWRWGRNRKDQ